MNVNINCPVCGSSRLSHVLNAKDYTVTGETFQIFECADCSLRFTYNAPIQSLIGKYYKADAYISHTDTRKGIVNKLYHLVRRFTLKNKLNAVKSHTGLTNGKLLDIGTGTGAFLHTAKLAGWQAFGLEEDAETRQFAIDKYGVDIQPSGQLFHITAASVDVVTMWHVLEHVHQLHEYMNAISSILKPGGKAFIAVPNYTAPDAAHYGAAWAAYDVPRHLYHFSPTSMHTLVNSHGLAIEKQLAMPFDGFYVSMLSEQYKTGRQKLIPAILQGFKAFFAGMRNATNSSSIIYVLGKN